MKIKKIFHKKIKRKGFEDPYIKIGTDHYDVTVDKSMLIYWLVECEEKEGNRDIYFEFYVDEDDITEGNKMKNLKFTKYLEWADKSILDFDEICSRLEGYIQLHFSRLGIREEFKRNGICSYIMLKMILEIISEYKEENFFFYLYNTSTEVTRTNPETNDEDNLKLYSKILNENKGKIQYRYFDTKNRMTDIKWIEEKLYNKLEKIKTFLEERNR